MSDPQLYDAFRQNFLQLYASLCTYAESIVKESADAEDIVQETFLKIWQQKKELIGKKELKFYLFTSVRNNSISFLQSKKNITELRENAAIVDTTEKRSNASAADLVQEALNLLPPKCREVFVLSRLNELKYSEIAETLNISVKTVENQMGKAIRIMREFYKERKGTEFMIVSIILGLGIGENPNLLF